MYKNQLQELAQRSCFNLPSYSCMREGPDHAPRFKASVNFNGETFESPGFCTTLRQAEHAAAEVALNALSTRGPSNSIAARILDETGVYKNLLQEIAQRVGAPLPTYTTVRAGLGHLPVFTGTVELAGIAFTGEPAKNKKQAEKNAAMAAWNCLKQLVRQQQAGSSAPDGENGEEQQQITAARALLNYRLGQKMAGKTHRQVFTVQPERRTPPPGPAAGSKFLPLIRPTSAPRTRPPSPARGPALLDSHYAARQLLKFSAAAAAPYVPLRHCAAFQGGPAPPVTIRHAVPVFAAPGVRRPPPPPVICVPRHVCVPPPIHVRQVVPAFAGPSPPPRPAAGSLAEERNRLTLSLR
ncbi:double-stranded RNA-binding protein 6-like isoform X2 [Wolffia australiana]